MSIKLALAAAYPYDDVLFPTALKKLLSINFLGILKADGNPSIAPRTNPMDDAKTLVILIYPSYNSSLQ